MDFPKVFELIMEAILEEKSVEIEYQKNKFKDYEITKRKITPKKFSIFRFLFLIYRFSIFP